MKTILIADDSLFIRANLKDIITKNGYLLAGEAVNGAQAIELYRDLQPDITFLDITMPILDGISALKAIKAFNPNAKVVMCSAMGQKNFIEDALKYGACDFIVKPFKPEKVLLTIKKICM